MEINHLAELREKLHSHPAYKGCGEKESMKGLSIAQRKQLSDIFKKHLDLLDYYFDPKRQEIMEEYDKLPKEIRELIQEHGTQKVILRYISGKSFEQIKAELNG